MSSADTVSPREISRATSSIVKGLGAQLAGKKRGPDHGEGRRVPRRDSYDVEDTRAKRHAPIGDGSVAQGLAHREAVVQTAEELHLKQLEDLPYARLRELQAELARDRGELAALEAAGGAPPGRRAILRQAIAAAIALIEQARHRLRWHDVKVLKAILHHIDFATGAMFPSIETIAAKARCHRNTVNGAIARLKRHGFLDWVRRTVKTGNEGEFAPQREQTSNAYFFDHRQKMAPRTWSRFWQVLVAKLRRTGATPTGLAGGPIATATAPSADALACRTAIAGLGEALNNAST